MNNMVPGDLLQAISIPILWADYERQQPHHGFILANALMLLISLDDLLAFVIVGQRMGYVYRDRVRKIS